MRRNLAAGLLLLRLSTGFLMLLHGIAKVKKGVVGMGAMLQEKGIPAFAAYGVYIGEIIAPLLLIIGFRSRIAALLIAFTMIVAVATVHALDIGKLSDSGAWAIELPALYLFNALVLTFTGGGPFAVSRRSRWD